MSNFNRYDAFGLQGIHVFLTGAAGHIGSVTLKIFLSAGAHVTAFDIRPILPPDDLGNEKNYLGIQGDITDEVSLETAFAQSLAKFGPVQVCIALASLDLDVLNHTSLADLPTSQWRRTFKVNVEGTFLTCRTFLRQLRSEKCSSNISLIIMGSESGIWGERANADYASGKSAVQVGLLRSLKNDIVRICPSGRVNAVAPGIVDTPSWQDYVKSNPNALYTEAQACVSLRKAIPREDVAHTFLFLASERLAGSISGQVIPVDGGKEGRLVWQLGE